MFAETHDEGKVIINDSSFNKKNNTKRSKQEKDTIKSQIWSYLI